jgi:hypothetical protein
MAKRDMSFFMQGKAKTVEEKEVIVSNRYIDDEGKIIPFVLKPIETERIKEIENECTEPVFEKGRKVGERLNTERFMTKVGIESTVYPNFKDKDLLKSYNVVDPVDLVPKILSIGGEFTLWIKEIAKINGLDDDFEEMVEEAKN